MNRKHINLYITPTTPPSRAFDNGKSGMKPMLYLTRSIIAWRSVKHNSPEKYVAICMSILMTSSNGNIFRVTGHLCGEFTGHRWIPHQWPVARNFDVFFDLRLKKRLSKQPWGWWFDTPSCSLWRHCNDSFVPTALNWQPGCQKRVTRAETSNYIPQYLWDVIICPCPWHPLPVHTP